VPVDVLIDGRAFKVTRELTALSITAKTGQIFTQLVARPNCSVIVDLQPSSCEAIYSTTIIEDTLLAVSGLGGIRAAAGAFGRSGFGDLTIAEVRQIQSVVNQAGRPLEVVGSAARGTRRGIGTDLPIGKGPGTRSDIDFLAVPSSNPYFRGLESQLPSLDPLTGIIPGAGNKFIGPVIRFEPGVSPSFIPGVGP
jgi:hypothetical protein